MPGCVRVDAYGVVGLHIPTYTFKGGQWVARVVLDARFERRDDEEKRERYKITLSNNSRPSTVVYCFTVLPFYCSTLCDSVSCRCCFFIAHRCQRQRGRECFTRPDVFARILSAEGFGNHRKQGLAAGVRVLERIYSWTVKNRISESRRWPF